MGEVLKPPRWRPPDPGKEKAARSGKTKAADRECEVSSTTTKYRDGCSRS
jgi:hypothetical protein